MERDNLHISLRTIQGYNKIFNCVISEREVGKSTCMWLDLAYQAYKEGYSSIVLRRQIADITEVYLNDAVEVCNKFLKKPIKIVYKKGSIKEGVVDVYIIEGNEKRLFFRAIALSNPITRIKSLILRNLKYILFDEFICNPKFQEKYLPGEATRFKELYNTFQRECEVLKCYFFGNPYSHFNPYFLWWDVDTKKLKQGVIIQGKNYVIQCYQMIPELRSKILEKNPLYQFDDAYKRYAFDGEAINDANIKLGTLPEGYNLKFVFKLENKFLGVYQGNYLALHEDRYFCKFVDKVSARRTVYCFDFSELVDHTVLLSFVDRMKFNRFKIALRKRLVSFEDIAAYYMVEEIYYNL